MLLTSAGEYIYYLLYLFAVVAIGVMGCTVLYYAAWGVICFFAWIEDEAERAMRARRRRARMKNRARMYYAGTGCAERTVEDACPYRKRPPIRSPFVSRRARYLLQHRERARRMKAGIQE